MYLRVLEQSSHHIANFTYEEHATKLPRLIAISCCDGASPNLSITSPIYERFVETLSSTVLCTHVVASNMIVLLNFWLSCRNSSMDMTVTIHAVGEQILAARKACMNPWISSSRVFCLSVFCHRMLMAAVLRRDTLTRPLPSELFLPCNCKGRGANVMLIMGRSY